MKYSKTVNKAIQKVIYYMDFAITQVGLDEFLINGSEIMEQIRGEK